MLPELWLFALGGLFVFVTLFMPKGVVGSLPVWSSWLKRHLLPSKVEAPPPVTVQPPLPQARPGE